MFSCIIGKCADVCGFVDVNFQQGLDVNNTLKTSHARTSFLSISLTKYAWFTELNWPACVYRNRTFLVQLICINL